MSAPPTGGLAMRSAALLDGHDTLRTVVEDGMYVVETPSRRDYWFGHGYRLAAPPERALLESLRERGTRRFGAIPGIERFTIVWETDATGATSESSGADDDAVEANVVLALRPSLSVALHQEVVEITTADQWRAVEQLSASEAEPGFATFYRWHASRHESAVREQRAFFCGRFDGRELLAFAGIYFDGQLGRFATPFTAAHHRGKGYFGECARACLQEAARRHVELVVIVAVAGSYQQRIYERLGAQVVGMEYAVVVDPKR